MNKLMVFLCAAVGIAAGAHYNITHASELVEHKIVNMTEQYLNEKGEWKIIQKERMILSECIEHVMRVSESNRSVSCKEDPIKIKRQPNGRWSSKGVSHP